MYHVHVCIHVTQIPIFTTRFNAPQCAMERYLVGEIFIYGLEQAWQSRSSRWSVFMPKNEVFPSSAFFNLLLHFYCNNIRYGESNLRGVMSNLLTFFDHCLLLFIRVLAPGSPLSPSVVSSSAGVV